ncbi:MAG TPA: HAD-IC family P-type ATPase, partial [Rhizomicrobium sp.]|nr:HAD-IC family P-type ATPase [Rhizomicrobium sp.]
MILAVWLTAQGMSQSRPSIPHGLSRAEAARLLKLHGPNELPDKSRRNLLRIVRDVFAEPMFALLLAGGVIYFMLGEPLDAFILLAFATFSVSIGVVQEARSERVLAALRSIAAPRALVVRDGETLRVPAREVVPGDFVLLSEGDRIPADGVLVEAHGLQVDESLLTGESVPVQKVAPGLADATPAEAAMIYAGTLAVRGSGSAVISATGVRSEMGRIGLSLQNITLEEPGLKEQLRWLVRDAAIFGVAVAVLVVLASGFLRHSWLEAALGGVAIGMSVMPEEIPLVLAVFMAMGAWRLSRAHILTRRASAIETLGSATVLCTDKTGTLTENRMRVELLVQGGNTWRRSDTEPAPSPSLDRIVTGAVAASAPRPTDPMDRAVHAIAGEHAAGSDVLLHTYPLTAEFLAFTNIWKHAASGDVFAAAKGAPEAIAGLCHLSPDEHAKLTATVDAFAREGIRLLAVADARLPGESSPATPHDIPFAFVGLVGFIDPVRASVPDAVRQCREAGVRVAMITGDYPATAVAIAGQAGIASDSVLTGAELEALDDVALAERIRAVGVFARIRPHQKLRIVEALKRDGEVVAMTGDGINDAPAIKAAHIGIAMGARGTDVAREAAALVLLDDEFSSIVAAIRLGRRIYDNLRKAIQYIVAV